MSKVQEMRENFKNLHKKDEPDKIEEPQKQPQTPPNTSEKKKNREQEWNEIAEKAGLSRNKAESIIRALFTGPKYQYTEQIMLPHNTIMVLGTRTTEDTERLEEMIHIQNPRAPEVLSGMVFRHNAAASLIRFGDQTFKHNTPDDFEENLEWLRKLQEPLCNVISKYLAKFDQHVGLAMDWIGIENF